jgi:hypothetical protein
MAFAGRIMRILASFVFLVGTPRGLTRVTGVFGKEE